MEEKKLVWFWAIMFFLVYPLNLCRGYTILIVPKLLTFGITSIVCFFWLIFLRYWKGIEEKKHLGQILLGNQGWPLKKESILILVFLGAQLLSWLFSSDIAYSFVADADSKQGFFFLLLLLMTFYVARHLKWDDSVKNILIMVASIGVISTIVFALIQFLGCDIGGMINEILESEQINYISTMGNTAIFGKYVCLICIPLFYEFMVEREVSFFTKILLGLSAFFFGMAAIISNTDATMLGLLLGLYVFFLIALKTDHVKGYFNGIGLILLGVICFDLMYLLAPNGRNLSRIGQKILYGWKLEILVFLVLLALNFFLSKKSISDNGTVCFYIFLGLGCLGILGIVGSFLYFSIIDRTTNLGTLTQYLRFSESWGTERGYVWTWCMELFREGNWKEKLFGYGQGMVPTLLHQHYDDFMENELGYYFENAHNVYLHYLVSTGILGAFSYIAILLTAFVQGIKKNETKGLAVMIMVVAAMDLVCTLESISVLFLWTGLGLILKEKNACEKSNKI